MAYYNQSNANATMKNHSDRFKYLKKITQILLPISVFSLLLSHSSVAPLFLQSYDYLVSNTTFKLKLFTYTTERNCIFLLCNGILVLIIQSSGLISKITPAQPGLKTDHRAEKDDGNARFEEVEKKGVGKVEILEEKISESLQESEVDKWEDDDEGEEEDGGIDREELEKKFEDFIKKVKMEIQGE